MSNKNEGFAWDFDKGEMVNPLEGATIGGWRTIKQIKLFICYSYNTEDIINLNKEVNSWIEERPSIPVEDIRVVVNGSNDYNKVIIIQVTYQMQIKTS